MSDGSWLDPVAGAETLESFSRKVWEIKAAQLAPRTVEEARRNLKNHVLPELGHLPVSKITPIVVALWYVRAKERLGDSALRNTYFNLSATMRQAVVFGIIRENPCRVEGAARVAARPRPDHDFDETKRIIDALPIDLRPVLWLVFGAPLRVGEVCALRRSDLDLEAGTLRIERQVQRAGGQLLVRETKNREKRTVALPPPVLKVMRTYVTAHPMPPTAPLFTGPKGGPLRREYVQKKWRTVRTGTGIDDFVMHDLRHVSLTAFAQAGATPRELMRRAGHRTLSASMHYQHAVDSRDRQIAERAAAALPDDLMAPKICDAGGEAEAVL